MPPLQTLGGVTVHLQGVALSPTPPLQGAFTNRLPVAIQP